MLFWERKEREREQKAKEALSYESHLILYMQGFNDITQIDSQMKMGQV